MRTSVALTVAVQQLLFAELRNKSGCIALGGYFDVSTEVKLKVKTLQKKLGVTMSWNVNSIAVFGRLNI